MDRILDTMNKDIPQIKFAPAATENVSFDPASGTYTYNIALFQRVSEVLSVNSSLRGIPESLPLNLNHLDNPEDTVPSFW